MTQNEKRRKKNYIDRPVQGAVLRRFLLHAALFLLIGSGLSLIVQFLANPFQSMETLWAAFWRSTGPFLIVMLALAPIFVWDTIKLTNRIVGPIHRLRMTLRQVNAGVPQTAPLHFRAGDFWADLADELNPIIERIQATWETAPTAIPNDLDGELHGVQEVVV